MEEYKNQKIKDFSELKQRFHNHDLQKTNVSKLGLSSGVFALDQSTPWKGFPKGKLSLLYGAEGTGKLSLFLNALSLQVNKKRMSSLISFSRSFNPINNNMRSEHFPFLMFTQAPLDANSLAWILEQALECEAFELIGVALEKNFPLLHEKMLKTLWKKIEKTKTSLIFITDDRHYLKQLNYFALACHTKTSNLEVLRCLHRPTGVTVPFFSPLLTYKDELQLLWKIKSHGHHLPAHS